MNTHRPKSVRVVARSGRSWTGLTLVEVVMSMAIISILMTAMMSAILISRRGIDDGTSNAAKMITGRQAIDEITADLRLALSVTEATTTAVTFTVPDRTGDDLAETIRYAWSGTVGDAVTRTFNGTTVDFVDDVHDLDFTFLTRTLKAEVTGKLLFVVGNASSVPTDDEARKTQFEDWGYTVTVIDDNKFHDSDDVPADYADAVAAADVVYISANADENMVRVSLKDATIGVVCEQGNLHNEFEIADYFFSVSNVGMNITDNSHYITSPFSTGSINIYNASTNHNIYYPPLASGADVLATDLAYNFTVLIAADVGASLYNGGTAVGRRVMLPWCVQGSNDFSDLTANGLTITQRAIEWAAGLDGTSGELQFGLKTEGGSSQDSYTSRIRCTQATLNQDATITDLVAYVQGPIGEQVRFGIYTDSGGEPGTKIVETSLDSLTTSTAHWHTINITPTDLTAGTYWLAIGFSDQWMYYHYSNGGKTRHKYSTTPTLPSTWGASGYYPNWTFSIYGVGTPLNE